MRLIAFLRAINVGGRNVTMEALCGHFSALGLKDVESFIASGNVLFTSRAKSIPVLEQTIEKRLRASLGYEVKVFIRTDAEVAAIARYKPFPEAKLRTAAALNVGFLAQPLGPDATRALMALTTDTDEFHVHGRELYWLCKVKQSESKMSMALFERALGVPGTLRGINTLTRLTAKYAF